MAISDYYPLILVITAVSSSIVAILVVLFGQLHLRPWIGRSGFEHLGKFKNKDGIEVDRTIFKFKNYGKLPASNLKIRGKQIIMETSRDEPGMDTLTDKWGPPAVVMPNEEVAINLDLIMHV